MAALGTFVSFVIVILGSDGRNMYLVRSFGSRVPEKHSQHSVQFILFDNPGIPHLQYTGAFMQVLDPGGW